MKTGKKIFLDVGGHEGQTLNEVVKATYLFDEIYCFEPMPAQYDVLLKKFGHISNLKIMNYGLLNANTSQNIYGTNNDLGASIYQNKSDLDNRNVSTMCNFIDVSEFFKENISENDTVIMKLNCEGSETLILSSLIESKEIFKIDNVMIDFDVRKIVGHQHEEHEVMDKFKQINFSNYSLENTVMIGNSHESRIGNWLNSLSFNLKSV